jgi:hypothetical protein
MDGLDDLGRELRERVGHEMRMEAEEAEQDAAAFELRRRRLADVAVELLSRGDTVTVLAGDRTIRGRLSYARGEIASVETAAGRVEVNLVSGVVLRIDERAAAGGTAPRPGSDNLRARLLEHELSGDSIEAWLPSAGLEVSGTIAAVGLDHVILRDGGEWVLQLSDIAWIQAVT